jgi:hypothetical protein
MMDVMVQILSLRETTVFVRVRAPENTPPVRS